MTSLVSLFRNSTQFAHPFRVLIGISVTQFTKCMRHFMFRAFCHHFFVASLDEGEICRRIFDVTCHFDCQSFRVVTTAIFAA